MAKKLEKSIEGSVVKLKIVDTGEVISCDVKKLPAIIQDHLMVSGAGHKLGDAAAGKEVTEISAAINSVLKGLQDGKWTTRLPASEKITKSAIEGAMSGMSDKDKGVIEGLMAKVLANQKAKAEAAAKAANYVVVPKAAKA